MSWDPTPGQRKLVFGGVVVALVAAGVYLTLPTFGAGPGTGVSPSPAGASERTDQAERTASPGQSPSVPARSPDEAPALDALLPLDVEQLTQAMETARRFVAAYATYRHDEEPAEYRDRLEGYVTDPIAQAIAEGDAAAPAAGEELEREEVVATATATVEGTRLVSGDSVVALVRADQTVSSTRGTTRDSRRYAVTVVENGGGWKVSNLAPAEAGNAGDVSG